MAEAREAASAEEARTAAGKAAGLAPAGSAAERRSAPIELLWDLVFAFAVTQVTTLLRDQLTWSGFGRAALLLALMWWAWSAYVWVANAHDPASNVFRAALLLATALIFLAGVALPRAFAGRSVLFASAYGGVRLLHLALYLDASRLGAASMRAILGFAGTTVLGVALLLAGAVLGGDVRVPCWGAAIAIDYAGPGLISRRRTRELQDVAVGHFAERYGLFVIVCLGESIAAAGFAAGGGALDVRSAAAVVLSLAITVCLWWSYFDSFAAIAERRLRSGREAVLAASDGYSYMHLLLVAGIIVFAVGVRVVVAHADAGLGEGARLALCGGVALYLAGEAAFRLRMVGAVQALRMLAVLACGAAYLLHLGAVATLAALVGVLAALVIGERRSVLRQP
jgi:low temperature requirement protein LtrA